MDTIHQCPPKGSNVMPCCGATPFEASPEDRMTLNPDHVTCGFAPRPGADALVQAVKDELTVAQAMRMGFRVVKLDAFGGVVEEL